jgi:hypothetical protein
MITTAVALLSGLLLAIRIVQGQNISCLRYPNCTSCAAVPRCGWANGVVCYPGTVTGASPPYSSNISWVSTAIRCPQTSCLSYTNCSSCLGPSASSCGWANGVACYPGTPYGASYPFSSNVSWVWVRSQCSATPSPSDSLCILRRNCSACTTIPSCGWANGIACYPGTPYGASPPYSSNLSWAWSTSQCNSSVSGSGDSDSDGDSLPSLSEGTYCGSTAPIADGINGIILSHGILSFYRIGGVGSSSNCWMRGSYSMRNSIVDYAPYFSTCDPVAILALIWYNESFVLTGMRGETPVAIQLSRNQCNVPDVLPSGRYETASSTGAAIVLLQNHLLLLLDGCNISGTYRTFLGSTDLVLQLSSTSCVGRSNSFTLVGVSYTNLTNGYWYLIVSYTINGALFTESTLPVRWLPTASQWYSLPSNPETSDNFSAVHSSAPRLDGAFIDCWPLSAVIAASALAVVSVLAILGLLFLRRHSGSNSRQQVVCVVASEPVKLGKSRGECL